MIGEARQTGITILFFTDNFVNRLKQNRPNIGPYVYPAAINNWVITARLLNALNIRITITKSKLKPMCTFNLVDLEFIGLPFSSSFKKSTQNDVVRLVSAESALEYAAAINPITKNNPITGDKWFIAIIGNSWSVCSGIAMPFVIANVYRRAPKVRNKRFAKISIIEKVNTFF